MELDPWELAILRATGKSARQLAQELGWSVTQVNRTRSQLRRRGYDVPTHGGARPCMERLAQIEAWLAEGKRQTDIARLLGISESAVSQALKRHALAQSPNHHQHFVSAFRSVVTGRTTNVRQAVFG